MSEHTTEKLRTGNQSVSRCLLSPNAQNTYVILAYIFIDLSLGPSLEIYLWLQKREIPMPPPGSAHSPEALGGGESNQRTLGQPLPGFPPNPHTS